MNTAVCGNYNGTFNILEDCLHKYSRAQHTKFRLDKFAEGRELIENMKSGEDYSLIFLCSKDSEEDINIIGGYIRERLKNISAAIVYISQRSKNIEEVFKYGPLNFIQYSVTEAKIFKTLKMFEITRNSRGEYFKLKNRADIRYILYKDIIYISSKDRKLTIFTENKTYSCYGKLEEFSGIEGFAAVHKSYVVNLNCIKPYSYKRLELINGDIIPISQSLRPYVRELAESL
ncbi:MAG: LytTR family transcriptional regulator DNA-binding domain-containing protein [Eubacterium sp.]|nr:LytTR family transcriptional regulator DNA-binding domain-containing protein [Eubacterium sp.]